MKCKIICETNTFEFEREMNNFLKEFPEIIHIKFIKWGDQGYLTAMIIYR
jgi:hypothetical protein